jgi:hypothetical protein
LEIFLHDHLDIGLHPIKSFEYEMDFSIENLKENYKGSNFLETFLCVYLSSNSYVFLEKFPCSQILWDYNS